MSVTFVTVIAGFGKLSEPQLVLPSSSVTTLAGIVSFDSSASYLSAPVPPIIFKPYP